MEDKEPTTTIQETEEYKEQPDNKGKPIQFQQAPAAILEIATENNQLIVVEMPNPNATQTQKQEDKLDKKFQKMMEMGEK